MFDMRTRPKSKTFLTAFGRDHDDDHQHREPTVPVVSPQSKTSASSSNEDTWIQASDMLKQNPALMTSRVLTKALENQPPLDVIQFMLQTNPKAASIPKEGPTALQVAVQHHASKEVVETLLEACPFALCVTNPNHTEDPLSHAKRYRKNETDLLELLSRPLSYWVSEQLQGRTRNPDTSVTHHHSQQRDEPRSPPPPLPATTTTTTKQRTTSSSTTRRDSVEKEELYNVKLLCAQTLKGHKKLSKHVTVCRELLEKYKQELEETKQESSSFDKEVFLNEVHAQQERLFFQQLIALDMKEKKMKAHMKAMEQRCQKQLDTKINSWKLGVETWKGDTEQKLNEWQVTLESEVKVNAHFRSDFSRWMESRNEEKSDDGSFMFATDLGEVGAKTPLFPKDVLQREKKRPWKPLFRHWDRILIKDEPEEGKSEEGQEVQLADWS